MSWLYETPLYVIGPAIVLLLVAALEVGRKLGRIVPVIEQQVTTIMAPILGLVALLLAFSYALAGERHALRREMSVQEANAIQTFWLRTTLVPEPTGSEMRSLVRRYVDLHFEHRVAGIDDATLAKIESNAVRMQAQLWALLLRDAATSPEARRLMLVTPALNAVIDHAASVVAAKENRIPDAVLVYLLLASVVAGVVMGYRPPEEKRNLVSWATFVVVLGGLLNLVIDIDRPRRGLVQADPTPYLRLRDSLTVDPGYALAPKAR